MSRNLINEIFSRVLIVALFALGMSAGANATTPESQSGHQPQRDPTASLHGIPRCELV